MLANIKKKTYYYYSFSLIDDPMGDGMGGVYDKDCYDLIEFSGMAVLWVYLNWCESSEIGWFWSFFFVFMMKFGWPGLPPSLGGTWLVMP